MDAQTLHAALAGLPLGGVRWLPVAGSTNDEAAAWAAAGAADLSLVAAGAQTAGRGRLGRAWFTPPDSALAFSLVVRPAPHEQGDLLPRLAALGALAVGDVLASDALLAGDALPVQIKWPNDVVLGGRKVAGVLAEAAWEGSRLACLVMGIGVNVAPASVPPPVEGMFPPTCVEAEAARPVDRAALLRAVVEAVLAWRPRLAEPGFIEAWEGRLAFRGARVRVVPPGRAPVEGVLAGLTGEGFLRVQTGAGVTRVFRAGDVHLRPVDSPPI